MIFHGAFKKVKRNNAIRNVTNEFDVKSLFSDPKNTFKKLKEVLRVKLLEPKKGRGGVVRPTPLGIIVEKIQKTFKIGKGSGKGKVRVAFDAEVMDQGEAIVGEDNVSKGISSFEAWLIRLTICSVVVLLVYFGVAAYTTKTLEDKISVADSTINKI